jgi:DNA-binding beta-propeller fold protein YncE
MWLPRAMLPPTPQRRALLASAALLLTGAARAQAPARAPTARTQGPVVPAAAPAAPAQAAPAPATGAENDLVFVLNSGDANIQVLNGATRAEVRRIPVLREVHHLMLTPDGNTLLVGDSGANEMLFINPATGVLVKREVLSNPYHLGFSPDGKFLVITSLRRDQVDIYNWDGSQLTLAARLTMPDMPSHLAFKPDSKIVYVTLQGNQLLVAVSLETFEQVWTLDVGPQPAGVIWHKDRLLVGVMGSDFIAVVDPEARSVERSILVGRGAHALFPSPGNGPIYVTSRVDSRITLLDPDTLAITKVLPVPGGPDCISFGPDGKLWVTLRWQRSIAVVDVAAGTWTVQRVGRSPHGILYAVGPKPAPVSGLAEPEPPLPKPS